MTSGYYWLTKPYSRPEAVYIFADYGVAPHFQRIGDKGCYPVAAHSSWKFEGPITYGN